MTGPKTYQDQSYYVQIVLEDPRRYLVCLKTLQLHLCPNSLTSFRDISGCLKTLPLYLL